MRYLVAFDDYHHDGCDKAVEVTKAEYEALPGDPEDLHGTDEIDALYERPEVDLPMSEFRAIEYRVPLV